MKQLRTLPNPVYLGVYAASWTFVSFSIFWFHRYDRNLAILLAGFLFKAGLLILVAFCVHCMTRLPVYHQLLYPWVCNLQWWPRTQLQWWITALVIFLCNFNARNWISMTMISVRFICCELFLIVYNLVYIHCKCALYSCSSMWW